MSVTDLSRVGHTEREAHKPLADMGDISAPPVQRIAATHGTIDGVGHLLDTAGHPPSEAQQALAGSVEPSGHDGQAVRENHDLVAVVANSLPEPARATTNPISKSPARADYFILLAADSLDDLEKARMAMTSRIFFLTRSAEEGGKGVPADSPEVAQLQAIADELAKQEHQATLYLQRVVRKHPLHPWIKATKGVGEKQAARLLASIGDPYLRDDGTPRTVSQLWSYCGYGDAAKQKRRKGQKSNWSPDAKMRGYLVACSCIKQRESPYRAVYDAAREAWADRETTDLHKHNHALRMVTKAVLRDLWIEAKRLHEGEPA